ncbi:MAG: hypothetical protein GX547_16390 [Phycisphaerae bacterium]|nr:hypothetical protein [Phycisphaerae bacterium]
MDERHDRPTITPTLADLIGDRARAGEPVAALAAEFHLTTYVVARICEARPSAAVQAEIRSRYASQPDADLALEARLAREYGLDPSLVHDILSSDDCGRARARRREAKRRPRKFRVRHSDLSTSPLHLRTGERYATAPTICPRCGNPLHVIPCRICRIRDLLAGGVRVWNDPKPTSQDTP